MFKQMLTKKKIICVIVGILLVLIVWICMGEHCVGTEHIHDKQP